MTEFRVDDVSGVDTGELLTLQRAAYATEARIYGPRAAGADADARAVEKELASAVALKVVSGHRIVGAVRAWVEGSVRTSGA